MSRKNVDITKALFVPEPPPICGTCDIKEVTHTVSIYLKQGLNSVTYSVCGTCAKKTVTVHLGAELCVR